MRLLFSIIVSSMACGFFAGLFVSGSWAWIAGLVFVTLISVCWVRAEMECATPVKEEDMA